MLSQQLKADVLKSLNDWSISLKNGHQARVVNIDFSRAFDSISHRKLLFKLNKYGISGNLLNILESFLINRTQRVIITNVVSDEVVITSGVPQGSVLGPLLFIVYVNDLCDIFTKDVTSKMFADDAKLYTEIRTHLDVEALQHNIDRLCKWSCEWQLNLSINKCNIIDFYCKTNTFADIENSIDCTKLDSLHEVKDLGVILIIAFTFLLMFVAWSLKLSKDSF